MNDQLNQLPMHLLDSLMITIVKEWLKQIRNIIVVHIHRPVIVVINFSKVYCVFVVYVLENVDLLLQYAVLFLVFVVDPFLYQNLLWFAFCLVYLAKGKLACFHVNYSVLGHFYFSFSDTFILWNLLWIFTLSFYHFQPNLPFLIYLFRFIY